MTAKEIVPLVDRAKTTSVTGERSKKSIIRPKTKSPNKEVAGSSQPSAEANDSSAANVSTSRMGLYVTLVVILGLFIGVSVFGDSIALPTGQTDSETSGVGGNVDFLTSDQTPKTNSTKGSSSSKGRSKRDKEAHYTYPGAPVNPLPHPDHHPPELPPGFKRHPNQVSDRYLSRAQPIDDDEKGSLTEKWGQWKFVDPSKKAGRRLSHRQMNDLYDKYPYGDIPRSAFPEGAWQTDPVFLEPFVKECSALVDRSIEAVLAEYGRSKFDLPDAPFEERVNMFGFNRNGDSFKGLVQRVLHAVMTEDTFTFVTGG
jgi:hypothetical protein